MQDFYFSQGSVLSSSEMYNISLENVHALGGPRVGVKDSTP